MWYLESGANRRVSALPRDLHISSSRGPSLDFALITSVDINRLFTPLLSSPNSSQTQTMSFFPQAIKRMNSRMVSLTFPALSFFFFLSVVIFTALLSSLITTFLSERSSFIFSGKESDEPAHLPLSEPDTIGNRCLYPSSLSSEEPCRPLLGHVQKRFRKGVLPNAMQISYSDAYRFAFIKLHKAAGTTVHYGYLHTVLCPVRDGDERIHHYFTQARNAPIRANCSEELLFPSLDNARTPPPVDRRKHLARLQHYFVFTVVRNPWERAVSSYEYCGLQKVGEFLKFAQSPLTFGSTCTANKTAVLAGVPEEHNIHWGTQADELCDATGTNCLVDYVVDSSRLSEMMEEVVNVINERRDKRYPPLPKFSDVAMDLNRNDKTDDYGKYYRDCEDCARLIRQHYIEDVTLFGYEFPYST